MTLMPNEQIIAKTPLILTNYRIRFESKFMLRSIMLEDLAFCSVDWEVNTAALVVAIVAALAAVGALLQNLVAIGGPAVVVALIAVIVYIMSRRTVLVLASAGGKIVYELQNPSEESVGAFVDQVEAAKNARLLFPKP